MGHNIRAIIGKSEIIEKIASDWLYANMLNLSQGYAMIFLTDKLFDDITELSNKNNDLETSVLNYFTTAIFELLQYYSFGSKLAYIETYYFGGQGKQAGVLFENGKLKIPPTSSENIINVILNAIGVYKEQEKDEFESIDLLYYRTMD